MVQRILSLLPSATEILYEMGAGERVMAVTHRCTYPKQARSKPRAITSPIDSAVMDSGQIDAANSKMQHEYGSAFVLDRQVILQADPDLIISQNICQLCAANPTHVGEAVRILGRKPELYEMNPHTVDDVMDSITGLAKVTNLEERGASLVKSLQNRIAGVLKIPGRQNPRVLVLEWTDPQYTAGHWVPDMVRIAGGENLISKSAERSRKTDIAEIAEADPDIIVFMACGFDVARTAAEYASSPAKMEKWQALRAVRDGHVYAIDADSYSSKPSHRIVTGIEILAKIIQPDAGITVPEGSFARL